MVISVHRLTSSSDIYQLYVSVISQNNAIKSLNDSIIDNNALFAIRLDEIERQTKLFDAMITKAEQSIVDLETEDKNQAGTISRYSDNERIILKSYTLISAQTNVNERLVFIRNTVKANDELVIDVNYVEMLDGVKATCSQKRKPTGTPTQSKKRMADGKRGVGLVHSTPRTGELFTWGRVQQTYATRKSLNKKAAAGVDKETARTFSRELVAARKTEEIRQGKLRENGKVN